MKWSAKRIQHPDWRPAPNGFTLFRKRFVIGHVPSGATLHIAADTRYNLLVNGNFVGRGPITSDPRWRAYDSYPMDGLLRQGVNVIGVVLYYCGINSVADLSGNGFGFIVVQVDDTKQRSLCISDKTWKTVRAAAWPFSGVQRSVYRMLLEQHDARKMPDGWLTDAFNDSRWQAAQETKPAENAKLHLVPRPCPLYRFADVLPEKLKWSGAIVLDCEADEFFLYDWVGSGKFHEVVQPGRIVKGRNDTLFPITIKPAREGIACLLFDMGHYLAGRLHLKLQAAAGAVVDMTFAESLPDHGRVIKPTFMGNWVRYVCKAGPQEFTSFELQSYRYVQILVHPNTQPVTIDCFATNRQSHDIEPVGRFETSDPVLNQLWQAGKNTLDACMHDAIYDNTFREQGHYSGDVDWAKMVAYVVYGNYDFLANGLRNIARGQRPDGGLNSPWPSGHPSMRSFWRLHGESQGVELVCHSLGWIMAVWRHYLYSGNRKIVAELYPQVVKFMAWASQHCDSDGLIDLQIWDAQIWIDHNGLVDRTAPMNCLFAGALLATSDMAKTLERPEDRTHYLREYRKLRISFVRRYWDKRRKLMVDLPDGKNDRRDGCCSKKRNYSEHTNSLAVLFDLVPKHGLAGVARAMMDWNALGRGTPWIQGFANLAMEKLNQPLYLHRTAHERWAKMVSFRKNRTFSERWHIPLRSADALCQSSSAVITYCLSTHILGVRPIEPGFAVFEVRPNPGKLKWARGVVPTPHGPIEVEWRRQTDGKLRVEVKAPPACRCQGIRPIQPRP